MRTLYLINDGFYDTGGATVDPSDFLTDPARDNGGVIAVGQHNLSGDQLEFLVAADSTCRVVPYCDGTVMHGPANKLNSAGKGLYRAMIAARDHPTSGKHWWMHPAGEVFKMLKLLRGDTAAINQMITHLGDMRCELSAAVKCNESRLIYRLVVQRYFEQREDSLNLYEQATAAMDGEEDSCFWLAGIFGRPVLKNSLNGRGPFSQYVNEAAITGNAMQAVGIRVLEMIISVWLGKAVHSEFFEADVLNLNKKISLKRVFRDIKKVSR